MEISLVRLPGPPWVTDIVMDFARGLRGALGRDLVGLYVGGSLVLDDFEERSSDIDFLAVTAGQLSAGQCGALGQVHTNLLGGPSWAASRLEGDYAPQGWLVPSGTLRPVPGCRAGRFQADVSRLMLSADNIFNLREQGIAVLGPPPADVLPVAGPDDVRAAVREMLMEDPGDFATDLAAALSLLDVCRSLAAIESGVPCSKRQGVAWAARRLGLPWPPVPHAAYAATGELSPSAVLAAALAIRAQGPPSAPVSSDPVVQPEFARAAAGLAATLRRRFPVI